MLQTIITPGVQSKYSPVEIKKLFDKGIAMLSNPDKEDCPNYPPGGIVAGTVPLPLHNSSGPQEGEGGEQDLGDESPNTGTFGKPFDYGRSSLPAHLRDPKGHSDGH